jgi:hypothetical protein
MEWPKLRVLNICIHIQFHCNVSAMYKKLKIQNTFLVSFTFSEMKIFLSHIEYFYNENIDKYAHFLK